MEYKIRSKNITITDAMRQDVVNTFNKLTKYQQVNDNDIVHIDVEFTKENYVVINTSIDIKGKNNFLKAEVKNADFYKAVDQSLHKLEEQLRKIKGKREDRHIKSESFSKVVYADNAIGEETEEEWE